MGAIFDSKWPFYYTIYLAVFAVLSVQGDQNSTAEAQQAVNHEEIMSYLKTICHQTEAGLKEQALISGISHKVPDSAFNVSHGPPYWAPCSRHPWNGLEFGMCAAGAWVPGDHYLVKKTLELWIQVDLGEEHLVYGIRTFGKGDSGNVAYVTKYSLAAYDPKTDELQYYMDSPDSNQTKVFDGNVRAYVESTNTLSPPLRARWVRLVIVEYQYNPALRWELYGHRPMC